MYKTYLPMAALRGAVAALALLAVSCHDNDPAEPHEATLYDICEVAPQSGNPAVLLLYPADVDEAAVLTAPGQTLGANPPKAGTSIFVAYRPHGGKPYVSDNVDIYSWAAITNISLQYYHPEAASAPAFADFLQGWDADPVYFMSAWRAGTKLCMRLKLPYSTEPRVLALVVDPATESDPIPTAYLFHSRTEGAPTFERQYYVAIDVASLWNLPACRGLRVKVATTNTPTSVTTLDFLKRPS